MQAFFISEEKLARQAYRYDRRYRLAAGTLIVAALLQVPFLVLFYDQSRISTEEESRRGSLVQSKSQIAAELVNLKETEAQLDLIKSWEPILRGRMPASAVLGAVEQTIPPEVVLSKVVLEARTYRSVGMGSGSFRVPVTYAIRLEGQEKVPESGAWNKFIDKFLLRLPPGSKVVNSTIGQSGDLKGTLLPCQSVLQAQASGNYFPLGVKRIDAEENL